jgi:hypothetical protein
MAASRATLATGDRRPATGDRRPATGDQRVVPVFDEAVA